MGIINKDIKFIDVLKNKVNSDSEVYYSGNYFTSDSLFELKELFSKARSIKFLLNWHANADPRVLVNKEFQLLSLDRKYKVNRVVEFIDRKISIRYGNLTNQNLLILKNTTNTLVYVLSPSNLDFGCLGLHSDVSNNIVHELKDEDNQYLTLFKDQWNQSKYLKADITKNLNDLNRDLPPSSVYKFILKEIFNSFRIDDSLNLKLDKIGLKDSEIWKLLYKFQRDAVFGAIDKIETYGGCIIADSVGLGKTYEALAIIKYYELKNRNVLVLVPKKLKESWVIYKSNNRLNIIEKDNLRYDLLNHTDLSRTKGKSGDIDLALINWGTYDLVVIDESHNFRNVPTKRRKDGISRYNRLLDDIIRSGTKTKVLMLSATPVNNKLNDLKNQIAFITEGHDNAFEKYGIKNITNLFSRSQARFNEWIRNNNPDDMRSDDLESVLDSSYFKILDMTTIARSRKHIEKYYDNSKLGKFPNRLSPLTVNSSIDTENNFTINELYERIGNLKLASYTPINYVKSEKKAIYEKKYDFKTKKGSIFKQEDREKSLIYLMRINLLKRLESSVDSFRLSVCRLLTSVQENIERVNNHSESKNDEVDFIEEVENVDIDDPEEPLVEELLEVGGKIKVKIQDINIESWIQDLEHDIKILTDLQREIGNINLNRDAKFLKLKDLIRKKIDNPINDGNKKIIIFTTFTDTAKYIYQNIVEWLHDSKGVYSCLITGSDLKTNLPECKKDLSLYLINFSPKSKNRDQILPDYHNEIDVLICTDCISEGQNLQDCDYVINYDIHWNPVRIIQRFGRIDRIGSTNENIQLVNFFPDMDLDNYIDLVQRVKGKMKILTVSAAGEEDVIDKKSSDMKDLEYRKKQLKELQNQVLDIEDVGGSISITDFIMSDFKMDLESISDEFNELEKLPSPPFSVVKSNFDFIQKGVIFCLKDNSPNNENFRNSNFIYPYFLSYRSLSGSQNIPVTQPKRILDCLRKLCVDTTVIDPKTVSVFSKCSNGYQDLKIYEELLKSVIHEIKGTKKQTVLDTLATPGGTSVFDEVLVNQSNIKLVSYLIIE